MRRGTSWHSPLVLTGWYRLVTWHETAHRVEALEALTRPVTRAERLATSAATARLEAAVVVALATAISAANQAS